MCATWDKKEVTHAHGDTRTLESMQRAAFSRRTSGQEGKSKAEFLDASVFVWKAFEAKQAHGISKRQDLLATGRVPWLVVSRSFDESGVFCLWPQELAAQFCTWQLDAIRANRWLAETDKARIIAVLSAHKRSGTASCLTERAWVRTPHTVDELFMKARWLQRGTASNLMAALDQSHTFLTKENFNALSVSLQLFILTLVFDSSGVNERYFKELIAEFQAHPNILVLPVFCKAHSVGTTMADALSLSGVQGPLYSWARLLKFHKYYTAWT